VISRPCGTGAGGKRYIQVCGGGNVREGDSLEGLDVDRRMILKWNFKTFDGGHGLD